MADDALLDLVQRQTFGYFWDFSHPKSGMARDRSGPDGGGSSDLLAVGGTGFGIMAMAGSKTAATRSSITSIASATLITISATAKTAWASPRATATGVTFPTLPIWTGG